MVNCMIMNDNLVAFTAEGFDFYEFKSGGVHEKHEPSEVWNS
jgi:hypothetical protein